MTYVIASDLGSQSVKTAIYSVEGKNIGSINEPTLIHTPEIGASVYYGDEFYEITASNIRTLVSRTRISPKDVAALSFSGMGGGILGVDEHWNPTSEYTNPIDCRDQQCFEKYMTKYADLIRSQSATGAPMAANKIVWLKEQNQETYRNSKKFMIVTQYVQGRLAGTRIEDSFWEKTSSAFTGLVDLENGRWSEEICDALEIDIDKLPSLIEPSTVIGTLTKDSAEDCGLSQGIPIVSGAYDKPSDTLGSGSNVIGAIVDNAATYPAITMCVDQYTSDVSNKTLECHPAAVQGTWLVMTYITGGGLTHRWFVENFYDNGEREKRNVYEEPDRLAEELSPGSQGLICIPHFCGRATPCNPKVRGQWIGVTWDHKKEHFYKSILESIAYDHATSLKIAGENYPDIDFTHATVLGGGAQSDIWNQIKSDVLGIPYHRRDREDFTTLGAAIIGGHAVGLFKDMNETARCFSRIEKTYEPRKYHHDYYTYYIDIYKKLLTDLEETYDHLFSLPPFKIRE